MITPEIGQFEKVTPIIKQDMSESELLPQITKKKIAN